MLSQYDEGYALEFEIRDGTDAASDLSAYTVTLKGTRADTLAYSFAGTVSTNVLTFVIDTTMTACAGRGTAEIAIKDTANDVLFATFNMPVFVERAAVPEGSIDADVERAQEIAEQVQEIVDNAAATVSGEAEKWATGQIDGTDVPSTDPTYENNAKYYAEQAADAAASIGIDATLTQTGKAADAKKTGDEISALKEDLSEMQTATSADVGKALKAKTVTNGKVTEWEFGETGVAVDPTLTIEGKAADAKATGDAIKGVSDKVDPLVYGMENIIPYDPSKVTITVANAIESELSHDYAFKATGYGGGTPQFRYTLPEAPSIASTDIMYMSVDIYIDAEQSDLASTFYRVNPFGHAFNQGAYVPQSKTWFSIRERYTQGSTTNATVLLSFGFASTALATNKIFHYRNLTIINLTQTFGAGNEPSIEEINAIVDAHGGYIDTINLFDAEQVTKDVNDLNDFKSDMTANVLVDFTNYYMVNNPTRKNDGSEYVANANGKSVSVDAYVPSANANIGDIIYCFGEFRVQSDADNCLRIAPSSNTNGEKSLVENPLNGIWYPCSARLAVTGTQRGTQFVATWENNASIRIYCKHVVAVNLTAIFGAYNEPTKEMLDQYFYNASLGNAIAFALQNSQMFNLSSPSRKLVHPNGCYVMIDDEGNVKIGSVPDADWSGWTEIGTYGQFNRASIPIYNKVHGTLETDGMLSVLPIWGAWSESAASQNTHHGGHVFHGWTTDRLHRLTMVQNIYRDDEAAVFNYIPGDKSGTSEGGFLRLRLGADNNYKGVLIENIYDPTTQNPYTTYQMARMTVYGRLNVGKPQNYNHIPTSSSADGVKGDFCFDSDYAYFCVADNEWKRIPLQSW